ncbi:MAG: hypothetical protein GF350_14510 [Chitinivibrionales bacterium]|nr:hypothetical protein [Chitinivibrionales bacterium]
MMDFNRQQFIFITMKTDLSFLPAHKQKELAGISAIIKKAARVEKIILFGSYARGAWVEDSYVQDGITYEYKSDMDILVVVKKNGSANPGIYVSDQHAGHNTLYPAFKSCSPENLP